MPETLLSLIQYFKDQHILNGLGNKRKNHLEHLEGRTVGVQFPPVTGWMFTNEECVDNMLSLANQHYVDR